MLLHQAKNPLLIDDPALDEAQIGPQSALPPEWVVSFELPDTLEQAFMAFSDLERAVSFYPSSSSLFFSPR
jgi:hypothetical protein